MGLLGTALTDWVGIGNVREFGVRFVKQTWPGEVLRTKIVVRDVADGVATLDCTLENADGEAKVAGEATAVIS
jgi:acyl dehydratase